jgi:translation initiation factor 4B
MTTKGKKKKGQSMSLGEFLGEETATTTQVVRNWAEEMENIEDDDTTTSGPIVIDRSMLPTAPKAALGPNIDLSLIPKTKPFVAHISNISYEADERQLRNFFKNLKIESVNLPTNERGSLKGYGYIEFSDRESLIEALGKSDMKFSNRPLKIQLRQENSSGDGRHDRQHFGNNNNNHYQRDQQSAFKSDDSDWRRRPSTNEDEFNNNSNKYMNNNYPTSETGSYRGSTGGHRGGRGSFNNRNRVYNNTTTTNNQYDRPPQRQNLNSSRSSNRSGGHQSSPNEQRYQPRQQRMPPSEQAQTDETIDKQQETPMERPKLILQPRSKPLEEGSGLNPTASSIFGGAKPVDTSARERIIEEKLQSLVVTKPKEDEVEETLSESGHEHDTSAKSRTFQRDRKPFYQKNFMSHDDDADSQVSQSTGGQRRFSNQSREFVNSGRISKSSSHDTRLRHNEDTLDRPVKKVSKF